MTPVEPNPLNQRELRKLILSIRANADRLDLFLAICDDRNLQEALIQQYEAELSQQGFTTYRTRLNLKQPSLKATLAALAEREPGLRASEKAVVTVLGGSELLGVRLTDEKSEQERFFFSLQWTRESLREFQFPVVVWLSSTVATGVAQHSQDFWSWRSGVFEFVSESSASTLNPAPDRGFPSQTEAEPNPTRSIPDLNQQIAELEQQNPQSPLLVTLYNDLGDAYEQSYAHELALQSYEKALKLAQTLKDKAGEARSFLNLGRTLRNCGRYAQAITFYEEALGIFKALNDHRSEADSLIGLGNVYYSLGQYQQVITFYQQSLAIQREIGNRSSEANSLIGLGNAYRALGQYQKAIDSYQQSLEIAREIGDRPGEANSLGNLGNVYNSLKQYQRAIDFYQHSIEIMREIGGRWGESNSLIGLGNVYNFLRQYQKAIDCHRQSLDIKREIGDRGGEANALGNLGIVYQSLGQYQQAIDFHQQSLEIAREIGDHRGEGAALFNTGKALAQIDDRQGEALQSYQQALAIYEALKLDHVVEQCKTAITELNQDHSQPPTR